jgi:dipeptidyl aminopeptidase/acylaminoacyl peptidase
MWSLDGNRLYFTEFPDFKMRSRVIGGTESQDFDNPGGFMHFEDITRDGRYFVLKSPVPRSTIWLQEVRDPRVRRVVAQHAFGAYQARVSPDGRWVAYASGQLHVYIQPFDRPGDPIRVSGDDSKGPIWRADGRELFFETGAALMTISIAERAGAMITGTPTTLFPVRTQGFVTNQPANVEVAANGQKFLVNTIVRDSDNAPLEVTLNWAAGLKK